MTGTNRPAGAAPTNRAARPCGRCGRLLAPESYAWKRRADETRHSVCRACQREVSSAHYRANAGAYKERSTVRKADARPDSRVKLTAHLDRSRCLCCRTDRNLLALVPVRERVRNASDLVRQGVAWPRIAALLGAGVVLCRGCRMTRDESAFLLVAPRAAS